MRPEGKDDGWDASDGFKRVHWFSGATSICGADTRVSLLSSRSKEIPKATMVPVCKRCRSIRERMDMKKGKTKMIRSELMTPAVPKKPHVEERILVLEDKVAVLSQRLDSLVGSFEASIKELDAAVLELRTMKG